MRILVVDDDEILRLTVKLALEPNGYTVDEAVDGLEAVEKVKKNGNYQVCLLDVNMPRMNGMEALQRIKEMYPQIFCLILTAHSDVKDAVRAIKYGAYDYLEKPVDTDQILEMIESAKRANSLVEAAAFSAPKVQFDEGRTMIGGSSEITKVYDIIFKLSKVDTAVLVRGESGTGKELVARAIHYNSHRKKGPFVAVNCAAIPENLIESELFGHEKGAYTGADKRKIGKFQFADGGTLFLDEIGDISQGMQVKLLRVLQEKVFTPVGSNQELKADLRIIAATNKPLEKMIEEEQFRSDLYFRLNVLPIMLPPLRSRQGDIAPLAEFMIKKFNTEHSRQINCLSPGAQQALQNYSWPGNIRELENVIEHAFILESSDTIQLGALPEHLLLVQRKADASLNGASSGLEILPVKNLEKGMIDDFSDLNYPALKEQFEREFLIRALKAFRGKVNQTAAHTKMTKVTLLRKLEKYGINPKEYHI
ncbi:MAG: sigma-54-dependent transcriptional regulator [Oligoflexales bacterium]